MRHLVGCFFMIRIVFTCIFVKNSIMRAKLVLALFLMINQLLISQVVINELESDSPSIDEKEFVELKSETPNAALDGYVLVFFNGSTTGGDKSYFALDLDGSVTDENGLLLIGSVSMRPFPQLLIPFNLIQNGADAVAIYNANDLDFPEGTLATTDNLIDALVYDTNDADDVGLLSLLGETVQYNEGASDDETSIQLNTYGITYTIATSTPRQLNEGGGVVFNPITISTSQVLYDEGDVFDITFTTLTPVTTNSTFSFTLDNMGFDTSDFSGNTTVTIPSGQNSVATTITIIDDAIDEGDEEPEIKFSNLESPFIPYNNFIRLRAIDNDFVVAPYGVPTSPTYGIVQNEKPSGYYGALDGKADLDLRQALQDVIANPNLVRAHSYRDIIDILSQADVSPANSNQVWLLYTEQGRAKLDIQSTSNNVGKWNREHTFPRSHADYNDIDDDDIGDGIDVYWETKADSLRHGNSDAHALRAADGPENTIRNNRFYGEYVGPTGALGSFRGDVARSVLFMEIRYNGLEVVNGFPNLREGKTGDLVTLLDWHRNDPPDDFEMNRNNVIYNWQKNRNPFIDQPDLVEYIWGTKVGDTWQEPLSIETFNKELVRVYPNPVKDKLYIMGDLESYAISVFSLDGKFLMTERVKGNSYIKLKLSSGLYVVKIKAKDGIQVEKIVID